MTTTGNTSNSDIYEAPALHLHGSVADLTQAALPGTVADASFPAGAINLNITISL